MRTRLFVLALAALAIPSVAAAQEASITGLGLLSGCWRSNAWGVSGEGAVVVGTCYGTITGSEAFIWTAGGGMLGLGDIPGGTVESQAYGASGNGSVVVGVGKYGPAALNLHAFRWTGGGGIVSLDDLPGGADQSDAQAVSSDGSVVVGAATTVAGSEAFRWTQGGGMVGLGDLTGGETGSAAFGVSADGMIVVGYGKTDAGVEAFRWTAAGGMVSLGDLLGGSVESIALDVSADGAVVVGNGSTEDVTMKPFRWTEAEGMTALDDLPGGQPLAGVAYGVSGDGSVIVGTLLGGPAAFVWDALNGTRTLSDALAAAGADVANWTLYGAYDVSEDGHTVVGVGVHASGPTEGFVAYLPAPEPGAATLGLVSLGALAWLLRERLVLRHYRTGTARSCRGDLAPSSGLGVRRFLGSGLEQRRP